MIIFCPHCGNYMQKKTMCRFCGPDICWWFKIQKLVAELGINDQEIIRDDTGEYHPKWWIKDMMNGDGKYHPLYWVHDNASGDGRYYPMDWVKDKNWIYRPFNWYLISHEYS